MNGLIKEAHIFYAGEDNQVLSIATFDKGNALNTRQSRAPRQNLTAEAARGQMQQNGWQYQRTITPRGDDSGAPYMIFTKRSN